MRADPEHLGTRLLRARAGVTAWLHEHPEAPDPAREEAKRPAKMLVRSLADIINRLIDDGAKLSDDEHETLDRAAAYAGE